MAHPTLALARLVDVRAGEGLPLAVVVANAILFGCSQLLVDTVGSTLFVANLEMQVLPWVYISMAPVSIALGYAYTRAEAAVAPLALLNAVLAVQAAGLTAFYFGVLHNPSQTMVLALLVWKDVHYVLGELQLWALAGLLFNVRQAKRLFGVVASAATLGILGAGLAVPLLVAVVEPIRLLPLAALAVMACLVLVQVVGRRFSGRFMHETHEQEPVRRTLWQLVRDRYIALTLIATALVVGGHYFLEYAFFDRVKERFTTEQAAASFFGLYYTAQGTATLLGGSFLTGWLLTRWGLTPGLVAAPAVIGVLLAAVVAFGFLAGPAGVFLWGIVLVKLLFESSSDALQNPTFRLLYQPLQWVDKLRVQGVRESILFPLAAGLSGAALLAINALPQVGALGVAIFTLLLLAATVLAGWRLKAEYNTVLAVAVEKRRLGGDGFSLDDAATVAVLERRLLRGHPLEVLDRVQLFEQAGHPELCRILDSLADHPDPMVRGHALERIGIDGCLAALSSLRRCAADEDAPAAVRSSAVKSLCRLLEAEALDVAAAALDHRDRAIRRGALVGLLRHGGIDGVLLAGGAFNRMKASRDPVERRAAAEILGEVGIANFYRPLRDLLQDSDALVRRAALDASGRIPNPGLLSLIVPQLGDPATRDAALAALVMFGDLAIPSLDARFALQDLSRDERLRLVRVLARIGTRGALASMVAKLDYPDVAVRHRILTLLASVKYAATASETGAAVALLRAEIGDAVWASAALRDVDGGEHAARAAEALAGEVGDIRARILAILTFLFPDPSIRSARSLLYAGTPNQRAQAMEVIDTVISAQLRSVVLPALDDLPPARLLEQLASAYPQARLATAERLREIVERPAARTSGWMRASALWCASRMGALPVELAVRLTHDRDDCVRETAVAVLVELDRRAFAEHAPRLVRDRSPLVAAVARERAGARATYAG